MEWLVYDSNFIKFAKIKLKNFKKGSYIIWNLQKSNSKISRRVQNQGWEQLMKEEIKHFAMKEGAMHSFDKAKMPEALDKTSEEAL